MKIVFDTTRHEIHVEGPAPTLTEAVLQLITAIIDTIPPSPAPVYTGLVYADPAPAPRPHD